VHAAPAYGHQAGSEQRRYPEWFLRTPAAGGALLAVGYAPVYGDTTLSIREAIDNASASLRVSSAVRVRAEYLQEVLTNGSVAYRGESYAEDTLASAPDAVTALDTVLAGRMLLVLAGTSLPTTIVKRLLAPAREPPAWVASTPIDAGGGAYAVGTASAHFEEQLAWKEAERQARRSLAFAAVTQMRSRLESRTGGSSDGALIASTSTELRHVQVLERWRDERRIFVLVHARSVRPSGQ
jgi:hypothetical protein